MATSVAYSASTRPSYQNLYGEAVALGALHSEQTKAALKSTLETLELSRKFPHVEADRWILPQHLQMVNVIGGALGARRPRRARRLCLPRVPFFRALRDPKSQAPVLSEREKYGILWFGRESARDKEGVCNVSQRLSGQGQSGPPQNPS